VAGVACALLLGGCGVLDEQGPAAERTPDPATYGPSTAVARDRPSFASTDARPPSAAVARALDGGQIGVVDLTGTIAIEPATLETSSDATLDGVRWSSWGSDGAEGSGELRSLDCQPTCARGGTDRVRATIKLTGSKLCDGRRYFETGELLVESGRQPAAYVRAPC